MIVLSCLLIAGGHSSQGCGCERLHHPSTGVQHRLNQCMPCVMHILSPTHTVYYSSRPLPLARLLQWTLLPFCLSLADQPRWNPGYARKCCSCSVFSSLRRVAQGRTLALTAGSTLFAGAGAGESNLAVLAIMHNHASISQYSALWLARRGSRHSRLTAECHVSSDFASPTQSHTHTTT